METHYRPGGVAGLATGQRHRILLFPKNATCTVPGATFAFGSAFPTAGVRLYLEHLEKVLAKTPDASLVVFGHADKRGSVDANKKVSDRRARALLALMTGDAADLEAVAREDKWSALHDQAIPGRGLQPGTDRRCPGPLTAAAVRAFQRDWNDGDFGKKLALHVPSARGALSGKPGLGLGETGDLDDDTRAAIRLAYLDSVPSCSGAWGLPRFAGCASWNPISDDDAENRRAVVGIMTSPTPRFPCKPGDAKACPVDGKKPFGCPFYRQFFSENAAPARLAPFFDFHWFHERTGDDSIVVHLSALTTLPDDTDVTFTVATWQGPAPKSPPQSWRKDAEPSDEIASELGTVAGKVRGGVAFAKWTPSGDYDPRKLEHWLEEAEGLVEASEPTSDEGSVNDDFPLWTVRADFDARDRLRPPVFRVAAGDAWGYSGPPARDVRLMTFGGDATATGLAVLADGSVVRFQPGGARELPALEIGLTGFARSVLRGDEGEVSA